MEKQERKDEQNPIMMGVQKDSLSRALLLCAILLYTLALVLLVNLVWAGGTKDLQGALVKVNNQLDGTAFDELNTRVKSVNGNILSIDIQDADFAKLEDVKGICASQLDHPKPNVSQANFNTTIKKYAGAQVVVGILDNTGYLSDEALGQLKKTEAVANVGFISYLSDDPNSTVIIRNLRTGESNLVIALAYMQEYARTVNRPLVIEMMMDGVEMSNPLFVQVCQKMAETGTQFIGENGTITGSVAQKAPIQMAFTMFNASNGQITDRSDFWSINEVRDQELMLLGSDLQTCMILFQNEVGFDKIYVSNSSNDIMMVTTLGADGEVSYFHLKSKEIAFIPRELLNGSPVLEDGLAGVYPFYSKKAVFNGSSPKNQFVDLNNSKKVFKQTDGNGMDISLASSVSRILTMTLDNLEEKLQIRIMDASGNVIYKNKPDSSAQSIQTKIDLSQGSAGIYYLDLSSSTAHQTFALMVN